MTAKPCPPTVRSGRTLAQLPEGESARLEGLELPAAVALRLMEMGFLPGSTVTARGAAPGGDPRVYRVDGSEVALRRDTAERISIEAAA